MSRTSYNYPIIKEWRKTSSIDGREFIIRIQRSGYPLHDPNEEWIVVYHHLDNSGDMHDSLAATRVNYLYQESYRKGFMSAKTAISEDILEWALKKADTQLNFS